MGQLVEQEAVARDEAGVGVLDNDCGVLVVDDRIVADLLDVQVVEVGLIDLTPVCGPLTKLGCSGLGLLG